MPRLYFPARITALKEECLYNQGLDHAHDHHVVRCDLLWHLLDCYDDMQKMIEADVKQANDAFSKLPRLQATPQGPPQ